MAMQTALCCRASLREIKAAYMSVRLSLGEARPRYPGWNAVPNRVLNTQDVSLPDTSTSAPAVSC